LSPETNGGIVRAMNDVVLRRVSILVLLGGASAVLSLEGCDKLKKGGAGGAGSGSIVADDASAAGAGEAGAASAGDSAVAAPSADDAGAAGPSESDAGATITNAPTIEAANANKVGRYRDETKIEGEAAKLQQSGIVRTFPVTGEFVAFANRGAEVNKFASRQSSFLVTLPNPKNPKEKLLGWVDGKVFEAIPDAGPPKTVSCKADKDCTVKGQACVLTGPARSIETCVLPCAAAPPLCPASQECEGEGTRPSDSTGVPYCVVKRAKADAGAAVATGFKVGDKVDIEWSGKWYPGAILSVLGNNTYRIHYDGFASSFDENVGASRLKKR
jgi:hypothetical protein